MPLPIAAIIAAGSTLAGQGINAMSQSSMNKKTRKWNEKMYQTQRADALSDYQMQNQYNHPSSQMARLREAGLNPNLVYGNGADAQGGTVRQSSVESWNPKAPELDLGAAAGAGISTYYQTQMQQATIDNLRVQNTVLEQEKLLKAAQTLGILATKDATQFDTGLKQEIKEYTVANAKAGVEKTEAEVQLLLTENEVKQAMKQPTLQKMLQEIINLKKDALLKNDTHKMNQREYEKRLVEINELTQRINNLALDGQLKAFELELKQMRQEASDWPAYLRFFNDVMDRLFRKNRNMKSSR